MPIPAGDFGHGGEVGHSRGRGACGTGCITQLTISVMAPGPDGAVGFESQTMIVSRSDADDVTDSRHSHGSITRGGRAIAYLSIGAEAPGHQCPVPFERKKMITSAGNGNHVREVAHDSRC